MVTVHEKINRKFLWNKFCSFEALFSRKSTLNFFLSFHFLLHACTWLCRGSADLDTNLYLFTLSVYVFRNLLIKWEVYSQDNASLPQLKARITLPFKNLIRCAHLYVCGMGASNFNNFCINKANLKELRALLLPTAANNIFSIFSTYLLAYDHLAQVAPLMLGLTQTHNLHGSNILDQL